MYELMIGAGADRERSVPALVVVGGVCLQSFFRPKYLELIIFCIHLYCTIDVVQWAGLRLIRWSVTAGTARGGRGGRLEGNRVTVYD